MAPFQKFRIFSHFLLTLSPILLWIPGGLGHLGSIYNGEFKPPMLQEHTRESRGPLLHSLEKGDLSRVPFLRHPSYTHKTLANQRLLRFHQGTPSLSHLKEVDLPTSDASFERFLTRFGAATESDGEANPDSPTFTPYVSARALSNMEKFFNHLRENLEALQKGNEEDDEDLDNESRNGEDGLNFSGLASPEKALASGYQLSPSSSQPEWKPRASGVLGLKKIRSFFPVSQNPESRARMGTNLGLGRKRRR